MSAFINRLISDDFLWSAITNNLMGKRKQSGTGFVNINCPMCVTRGHNADRKLRCGIKNSAAGVGIFCFNCDFKARWRPGETLSRNMQGFLAGIGIGQLEINKLNHKAFSYRSLFEKSPDALALLPTALTPTFEPKALPPGAKTFDEWATQAAPPADFLDAASYLFSRGEEIASAGHYYWSPDTQNGMNRRVIIPFVHEGRTVGYTARSIDGDAQARYHMETPSNFLFNMKALTAPRRKYVLLLEGVFDALAVDGVGTLGARLNAQQIAWIKSYAKTVILVPDRDKRGEGMIDLALENNFHVAFPTLRAGYGFNNWWESDVKDAAEAVKRYGRLWTTMSIIQTATDNKMAINTHRKWMF